MSPKRGTTIVAAVAAVSLVAVVVAGSWAQLGNDAPVTALGPPHFIDETASSSIHHTYQGDFPYSVGGGVAVLDCDDDGRPDLFIAGGSGTAAMYRNESPVGGALAFAAVDDPAVAIVGAYGAYPVDVDGDANADLMVLRDGENIALRGLGDCRFESANARLGLDGGNLMTTAFSATWEGTDRLPTLAFGNYLTDPDFSDPDHLCADNQLVRPRPDEARYDAPIPLTPAWCALSMLFSDWDRSGRRDLRISNDRHYYSDLSDGQEQLWRIAPGEAPRPYGADDGWLLYRIQGMGIGSHDVTNDGYPEAYLTSQGPNVLQTLLTGPSKPTFRDIALKRGVEATRPSTGGDPLPSTAWHPEFVDVNNDALIDLFVSKGNVDNQADYASKDPSDLFFGQPDGTFVQAAEAAGVLSFARGRGASLADLNLDGLPDLVLVNYRDPVMVWRNVGTGDAANPRPMGHWLALRLVQSGANRDAIGAWIDIEVGAQTFHHEVVVGGGHAGGRLGWVHVGLGAAEDARVRVQWPDGQVGPWQAATADEHVIVERGAAGVRPWQPPSD
jgi:hypothetical protein